MWELSFLPLGILVKLGRPAKRHFAKPQQADPKNVLILGVPIMSIFLKSHHFEGLGHLQLLWEILDNEIVQKISYTFDYTQIGHLSSA